jgi:hypothetical protein
MRNIFFLIAIFLTGCIPFRPDPKDAFKTVVLENHFVQVSRITTGKYPIVLGRFQYKGKTYQIQSDNSGKYQDYDLSPGDTIQYDIVMHYYKNENDPDNLYDDVISLYIEDMILKEYETNY